MFEDAIVYIRPRAGWLLLMSTILAFGCVQESQEFSFSSSRVMPAGTRSFAVSPDGTALMVAVPAEVSRCDSSLVLGLNPESLYFSGSMTHVSKWVVPMVFVSNDFGFVYGCSIDPETAAREGWPNGPSRLERIQRDGSRSVILDTIDAPISSITVSAKAQLVAVGCDGSHYSQRNAKCDIYSLEDGLLRCSISPPGMWRLKAAFVGESDRCLIVSRQYDSSVRAYLISGTTGQLLHESEIHDDWRDVRDLVSSKNSSDVFVALNNEVGRFKILADRFEYERLTIVGALSKTVSPFWLAYDSDHELLAIGEEVIGVPSGRATTIFSSKTLRSLAAVLPVSGPMCFADDAKSGEMRLYMTPTMDGKEPGSFGDLRKYLFVGQL